MRGLSTVLIGATIVAAGCRGPAGTEKAAEAPVERPTAPGPTTDYPAPRFPSYLVQTRTAGDLLPQARRLVRNKVGFQGIGFGAVDPGDSILIVTSLDAEQPVVEAIRAALAERDIKADVRADYELAGVSREEARAIRKGDQYTSEQGFREAATWIEGQFPDAPAAKAWLLQQRPDLHEALFPPESSLSPALAAARRRLSRDNGVGDGIRKYLDAHPKARGIFWGKGGVPWLRRAIHPHSDKMLGLFTVDNRYDLLSAISSYPGDVWMLAEEQSMEPLSYVDRIHITDPEGTDISAELDPDMASRWSRGAYERGHLYLFPNQATGRWAASVVNYPALEENGWLPREPMALANGVIAGTANHRGFFPRWEVALKEGYVTGVKGGGIYGDTLRTFLNYPKINDLTFPMLNHKGYWYHYEIASGTHPKGFRHPVMMETGGGLLPERLRAGVVHWGLGVTLHASPQSPQKDPAYVAFVKDNNMPGDHGFHTHTYFTTYRVRLRNTERWSTLVNKGRLSSLDHPEVRALASRYGNPSELLAEDWIPEVPGINVPGDYQKYAADPWAFVKPTTDRAVAGTYKYMYPPPGPQPAAPR